MSGLVSQISPPIRILLVGAVVFLAAWFTVLKPKPVEEPVASGPVPAAPGAPGGPQSTAGEFAAKAKTGAAKAEADAVGAANAGVEEDGQTAAAPTAGAGTTSAQTGTAAQGAAPTLPALTAESLEGLPKALRSGLRERKVVVLGVLNTAAKPWRPMADDDRLVRNVLDDVNRYRGGVVVRTALIGRLARYDGLLSALQVTQSPTVVVVDRNRRAVAIEGYVDRLTVNQAIADARRTSVDKRIKDPYLRKVNVACGRMNLRFDRFSNYTVRGARRRMADRLVRHSVRNRRSVAKIAAPTKWRGLRSDMLAVLSASVDATGSYRAALRSGDLARANRIAVRNSRYTSADRRLDRRLNAAGLTACPTNRTR